MKNFSRIWKIVLDYNIFSIIFSSFMFILGFVLCTTILVNTVFSDFISFTTSTATTLFFSLLLLVIALWWYKEFKIFHRIYYNRLNCWRYALFLFFLGLSIYGGSFSILIRPTIHNYLIALFTISSSTPAHTNPQKLTSTIPKTSGNVNLTDTDGKPSIDLSTGTALLGLILVVVTAYYLITLQGTYSQAKELLTKLENERDEIEKLKQKIYLANNNADSVFRSLGKFIYDLATFVAIADNFNTYRKNVSRNTEILDFILRLYDQVFLAQYFQKPSNTNSSLLLIHTDINELTNKLNSLDYDTAYTYIPLGLLEQIEEFITVHLQQSKFISHKEREKIYDTLDMLKTLQFKVKQRAEKIEAN